MEHMQFNRFMAVDSLAKIADHSVHGTIGAMSSMYDQDYSTFQQTAHSVSSILGAAATGIGAIGVGASMHRRFGMMGGFYQQKGLMGGFKSNFIGVEGGFMNVGHYPTRATLNRHAFFAASGSKNVINKSAKELGLKEGFFGRKLSLQKGFVGKGLSGPVAMGAVLFGIPMAIEQIGGRALGFAGKMLDQAHMGYQQAKNITYDNRFFQNRMTDQWGMDMQQQVGAAMNDFSNRMTSTSRIYHSRG
jgi:hypothetical protein